MLEAYVTHVSCKRGAPALFQIAFYVTRRGLRLVRTSNLIDSLD